MSSPGLGVGAAPQTSLTNLLEQKLRAERVVKAGANWFLTVAALSMINSVLSMSGAHIRFIFGLGIAQFVDALAQSRAIRGCSGCSHQWLCRCSVRALLELCQKRRALGIRRRHGAVCGGRRCDALFPGYPGGRFPRVCAVPHV